MKTRLFAVIFACGLAFAVYVQASAADSHSQQARFKVGNILCGACASSVKAALLALPGVQTVTIGSDHLARISYDSRQENPQSLRKAIVGARHPHQGLHFTATLLQ